MTDARELRFNSFTRSQELDRESIEWQLKLGDTFIWDLTDAASADEDCAFCDVPDQQMTVSPFDIAVPIAEGNIALKAALGMMRPGYLLGVTRQHTTSFAQLSRAELSEVDQAFSKTETRLQQALNYDGYIRLEHGSDNVSSCGLGAGACVTHAHQHLIPDLKNTGERMLDQDIAWETLGAYEELASLKGEPYLYVGSSAGHFVAVDPKIKSQWGRRIVAEVDGHNDWDWAVINGAMNMLQTFLALGYMPRGRMKVGAFSDQAEFYPRLQPRGEGLYK